jgi:hypothetical protein
MSTFTLDKAEYFELKAKALQIESVELEAMKAAQQFAARRQQAAAASNALFEQLGQKYGFDPGQFYRWDDATCSLIQTPEAT